MVTLTSDGDVVANLKVVNGKLVDTDTGGNAPSDPHGGALVVDVLDVLDLVIAERELNGVTEPPVLSLAKGHRSVDFKYTPGISADKLLKVVGLLDKLA